MGQVTLLRRLGLRESFAIVVGSVIGTGIFLKTAAMAQAVGSPGVVIAAWVAAGALSFMGALTYAELGCMFPAAGGEYVFLREAYGPMAGFLYGWTRFWIASPGSIAAYAIGAATFLEGYMPLDGQRVPIALAMIACFTFLNCFTVAFGGALQTLMTAIKIILILALGVGLLFFANGSWSHLGQTGRSGGMVGFGTALLAALWAFDGWNNLPMAAGEIKEPRRVIPRALALGLASVFALYALVNIAYFYTLDLGDVLSSYSSLHPEGKPVATVAAIKGFGARAAELLSIAFVFSALGAMNGSILTGARVPYAMARDGLFFKMFSHANLRTHTPLVVIVAQGAWACVLALSGSFDLLTDSVVFASWIFYALNTASLFKFRRAGRKHGGYETPFFPWPPIVFLACTGLLLANTLWMTPRESGLGAALIALGVPAYYLFRRFARA